MKKGEIPAKEKAPKGYKNTLDEQQAKRVARREKLNAEFNKVRKDPF